MTTDPSSPGKSMFAESEAREALQFYDDCYDPPAFAVLEATNKPIMLGSKPLKCRFCDGEPPSRTFRKRAHAVSELLGNKILRSLYECDRCNERFAAFEDDLAKMTLPYRTLGGVIGKKGIPALLSATGEANGRSRMEFKDGTLHMLHGAGDGSFLVDEISKTIEFRHELQPYRPLGAYKALAKSAFTLLPSEELMHFNELKQWLLQKDVATGRVYADGCHKCFRSFVPNLKAFPHPIVALFRRKQKIDAPYMSMFLAFGNISYQIFLPSPTMDEHLRGKSLRLFPYPHPFQLRPELAAGPVLTEQVDLSACERTTKRHGTMRWRYENRIKRD